MTLAALIRKREKQVDATATSATSATYGGLSVATVAAPNLPEPENSCASDDRIERMIGRLEDEPDLIYAMEIHSVIELEAIFLTLAIRGKYACELRIPKSKFDRLALMEMVKQYKVKNYNNNYKES